MPQEIYQVVVAISDAVLTELYCNVKHTDQLQQLGQL